MIDLHCHILPAVDDGATDLDAALEMCRLAAADGCTAMVATPHLRHEQWWNGDRPLLERLWRRLKSLASGLLEVHLGGEIAVNSESWSELTLLPDCGLLPLAGSRYLLLEFDPRGLGPNPEDLIHELVVRGWCPVIAHPERIPWLAGDPPFFQALLGQGALAQVTARSLLGGSGRFVGDAAAMMLEAGWVHFVASDAHDTAIRRPGLGQAYRQVARTRGEPVARQLFVANPRAVLDNRPPGEISAVPRTPLGGTAARAGSPVLRDASKRLVGKPASRPIR